jgi:hypothetical protein
MKSCDYFRLTVHKDSLQGRINGALCVYSGFLDDAHDGYA